MAISAQRDGVVRVWDLARMRELSRHQVPRLRAMACGEGVLVIGTAEGVVAIDYPGLAPTM